MRGRASTSLKRITKSKIFVIFALCASIFVGAQDSFAQSRRSKNALKRLKDSANVEEVELSEFDVKIGTVVAVEGDRAVVKIRSYQIFPKWEQIFYACDTSMNAVAILNSTAVKNKSCSLFIIKSGTAQIGDIVFLKQIPPTIPSPPTA